MSKPRTISMDNGLKFASKALDAWAYRKGVTLDFSRPSKPTDNAMIESFNARARAESLNVHRFESLEEARETIEAWGRIMSIDPTAPWATWPPGNSLQPARLAWPVEVLGCYPTWAGDGVKTKCCLG